MSGKSNAAPRDCVPMVGPDDQLDVYSNSWRPTNPLPVRCKHCSFPDIDFAPNPYLLARGFSSPAETWSALCGNFLVRERVRRILELAVPKACDFYSTAELKSKKATPWFLAVPKHIIAAKGLSLLRPEKCSKCGEPKSGYDDYDKERRYIALDKCDRKGTDIFKLREWSSRPIAEDRFAEVNKYRKESGTPLMEWSEHYGYVDPPTHDERWTRQMLERELIFSVRLATLLKKAKVKGKLVVFYCFNDFVATTDELAWVDETMALLAKEDLVVAPEGGGKKSVDRSAAGKSAKASQSSAEKKAAAAAEKWFKEYLKTNAKKKAAAIDFAAVEKKQKLKLPKSYKDFIATVGSKSFRDVNDMEGSTTKVLPPKQLDFSDYRAGALKDSDEDSAAVDGVMFAVTDHGDCFVFDISSNVNDYPVFYYNHELNAMEAWSENFAGCIKRFAEKN